MMTDEQIIKEIKSLIKAIKDNNGWWENEGRGGWFNYSILEDALTVIQRLKSQVNRLKKYDEERDIALHARLIATAHADAVRVFAEMVLNLFPDDKSYAIISRTTIKRLVQEMTEGEQ